MVNRLFFNNRFLTLDSKNVASESLAQKGPPAENLDMELLSYTACQKLKMYPLKQIRASASYEKFSSPVLLL